MLKEAPWGKYAPATAIGSEVERRIRELKDKPGKNIVIYGSARTVQSLTRMGLIDEYQLLVHPIFLGEGKPLFEGMLEPINLHLTRTQACRNGVNIFYYEPRSSESHQPS